MASQVTRPSLAYALRSMLPTGVFLVFDGWLGLAAGMIAAAHLSHELLGADLLETHETHLRAAGLPLSVPAADVDTVLAAMGRDKKRRVSDQKDEHRFVLLEGVGQPIRDVHVSAAEARRAIGAVLD